MPLHFLQDWWRYIERIPVLKRSNLNGNVTAPQQPFGFRRAESSFPKGKYQAFEE